MKNLATYGVASFGGGIAALMLTLATPLGPCGPSTPVGHFLISIGSIAVTVGVLMMIAAILRAAFGRSDRWR